MKHFLKYLIIWISESLSIPFWVVGHIHLTMNVYQDLYEIVASVGMNILVAVGFFLRYRDEKNKK